ncbi:interferon-induced 35 kDa protein [Mastacembelus armatus]|uniref:Interferon-induced protein 35 n=1 Tax=Mastacembelus armatus TaxID=205130 RepID=A0A3Q3NGM2_9TELE|nr:interferon-induced 35 kDa protein [Mastacembelus armatus]XP_026180527.1 interferon-induced 35 kDa protein [Mastacembelus armatus]
MSSSDKDFSLVNTNPSEDTLEGIKALINNEKKKYDQLLKEQKELSAATDEIRGLSQKFKDRAAKMSQTLGGEQLSHMEQIENEKAKRDLLEQEEKKLLEEIRKVEAALKEEKANSNQLKEQTDVFTAVPEKSVVFKGVTEDPAKSQRFEMKARIVYPMLGGTALVTFEDKDVASKILELKQHQVDLGGECSITVEAKPVALMMPKLVEINSEICPQRILVSNLPKMDTEKMLNKLEIHFSKRKHGGGEVEECEMLPDSGTVVITFVEKNIAKHLTQTEHHDVKLHEKTCKVRVTPFLNGKIINLQTKISVCPRTVLLTGIPPVMEQDTMQDTLEIFFQKSCNGGGEIEAFLYNPLGQQTSALFESVPSE